MVPDEFGDLKIKAIKKDEKIYPFTIRDFKGSDYAFVTVESGYNHSFRVDYEN
jgi:hypothetical protein